MSLLQQATFLTTVANLRDVPVDATHEVAFVGRSNAGKSSAINTLANHVRLAYVSKTPGRTQHLNYFTIAENKYLVDLPGYGFAKAPEAVRKQWDGLLGPYLQKRVPLVGVVLIMDARHPMTELDVRMFDWLAPTGRPIHVLLSKSDKLSRQQAMQSLWKVQADLKQRGPQFSVQLFSSLKKSGIEEAEAVLSRWFDLPLQEKKVTEPPKIARKPGEKRPKRSPNQLAGAKNALADKAPAQGGEAGDGGAIDDLVADSSK